VIWLVSSALWTPVYDIPWLCLLIWADKVVSTPHYLATTRGIQKLPRLSLHFSSPGQA